MAVTYTLTARPTLLSEGRDKGRLEYVSFTATSGSTTQRM